MKRNRFINENNMGLLRELVHNTRNLDGSCSPMLDILEKVLDGSLKPPFYTPEYLVTMNSTVRVMDIDTKEEVEFSLVYPDDAAPEQNKISVLDPLGMAVLGSKIGDPIEWQFSTQLRRLKVIKILYQPEASGHLNHSSQKRTQKNRPKY
ncbi:GreA/GreB family elongation factor [Planctomycetota bacterium]